MEVTCEADATPKPKLASTMIEEKASLIAELPVDQVSKDKAQSSTLSFQLDENTEHSSPLVKQIPIIQSVITVSYRIFVASICIYELRLSANLY